jgi:RimJ/RimL family protein N-acetyltransferase
VITDSPSGAILGAEVPNRSARRPEKNTILSGNIVDVYPLDAGAHGDSLFRGIQGPENDGLWTYLAVGPFHCREDFDRFLIPFAQTDDPLPFAIVHKKTQQAVGIATYLRIEPNHRVIEVGHLVFTPTLQKTAGATEAMYLMARHVFEDLGYRRYEWKCNALHSGSRQAALRLGFQFEGIFRQHQVVKGRNRDTAWFSMLDSEWPRNKRAMEAWLDPDNFDEQGKQKLSLAAIRSQLAPARG